MNYTFLTTMYEMDIRIHTEVTSRETMVRSPTMKMLFFYEKIVNNIFLPEIHTFRQNTFMISVVHVHVNIFA